MKWVRRGFRVNKNEEYKEGVWVWGGGFRVNFIDVWVLGFMFEM